MKQTRAPRVSAGVPAGGQFAAKYHAESTVSLVASEANYSPEAGGDNSVLKNGFVRMIADITCADDWQRVDADLTSRVSFDEVQTSDRLNLMQSAELLDRMDSRAWKLHQQVRAAEDYYRRSTPMERLAASEYVEPSRLLGLAKSEGKEVGRRLARNPRTPGQALAWLAAKYPNSQAMRVEIARHPLATPDVLHYVAEGGGLPVREAVAAHPRTRTETIQLIQDDAMASTIEGPPSNRDQHTAEGEQRNLKLAIRCRALLRRRAGAQHQRRSAR